MVLQREHFAKAVRIVVKVGTSQLTDEKNRVVPELISRIVAEIAELHSMGKEVVLVTSGAVGVGLGIVGSFAYPKILSERQALAAMGQSRLMHMYEKCFGSYNINIGQVILTAQDIYAKERYLNVRNTLIRLLEFRAIPIINENDTVSVEEIKFGDNDTLSAHVALCVDADLIILTDTDGLFSSNPKADKNAKRFSVVKKIDKSIVSCATGTDKSTAIGGMETKIAAARVAVQAGVGMVIACGYEDRIVSRIISGEDIGTFFVPSEKGLSIHKRWFAHARKRRGSISIDDGCKEALLKKGKSVLPIGVIGVNGTFSKGDSIMVIDSKGRQIGVGLTNYSSVEAERIIGKRFVDEIVHRDNFVRNQQYGDENEN